MFIVYSRRLCCLLCCLPGGVGQAGSELAGGLPLPDQQLAQPAPGRWAGCQGMGAAESLQQQQQQQQTVDNGLMTGSSALCLASQSCTAR